MNAAYSVRNGMCDPVSVLIIVGGVLGLVAIVCFAAVMIHAENKYYESRKEKGEPEPWI